MYYNEENNYYNLDKNIDIDDITFNRNSKLYNVSEGFNKGNLFKDLYNQYKNHSYTLKVKDKKGELLYKYQMYNFALKDLNLYLDTNPNDKQMLKEFIKLKNEFNTIKNEYEKSNGAICYLDSNSNDKFEWINNPWPWDKGGNN